MVSRIFDIYGQCKQNKLISSALCAAFKDGAAKSIFNGLLSVILIRTVDWSLLTNSWSIVLMHVLSTRTPPGRGNAQVTRPRLPRQLNALSNASETKPSCRVSCREVNSTATRRQYVIYLALQSARGCVRRR